MPVTSTDPAGDKSEIQDYSDALRVDHCCSTACFLYRHNIDSADNCKKSDYKHIKEHTFTGSFIIVPLRKELNGKTSCCHPNATEEECNAYRNMSALII